MATLVQHAIDLIDQYATSCTAANPAGNRLLIASFQASIQALGPEGKKELSDYLTRLRKQFPIAITSEDRVISASTALGSLIGFGLFSNPVTGVLAGGVMGFVAGYKGYTYKMGEAKVAAEKNAYQQARLMRRVCAEIQIALGADIYGIARDTIESYDRRVLALQPNTESSSAGVPQRKSL